MKKRSFLLFAMLLLTGALFSQQLTFRYANPRIIRVGGFDNFEFDVQVKASAAGTFLWGSSIIIYFDNIALSTLVTQWTVTKVAPFDGINLNAGNPMYGLLKTVTGSPPNSVLNIGLVGDINTYPYGPSPDDFVELTTSYQTCVHVRGRITDITAMAGIHFKQTLMNGQQSFLSSPSVISNYTNPTLYDASDLTQTNVGRVYSNNWGWSQVGNSANAQWVDWTTAVNTTVWDGTATIPGGSVSNISNLNILSPATLTIPVDGELTVTGNTNIVTANGLIIQSNATTTGSFLNTGTITGTASVQKYLPGNRWWYVGSPISNAEASALGPLSILPNTDTRLFSWNETTGAYLNITDGTTPLAVLSGYPYKNYAGLDLNTAVFAGNLNNAPAGMPIGTINNLTRTVTGIHDGYNLISNPFPSAINLGDNLAPGDNTPGLTMTNLEPTMWFRNNSTFATYNWTSGIGSPVTTTQFVPEMQAFWMRVAPGNSNGTFSIDNQARVHNNQSFYKKDAETNVFRIEALNGASKDETVVYFNSNAQNSSDAFDSEKMFATDEDYPQVFTLTGDNLQVAINGENEISEGEDRIVPLGFLTNQAGIFTLNANNINDFQSDISVYLEDVVLATIQDLRLTNSYTFTSGIVNNSDRFRLHFGTMASGVEENASNSVAIYAYSNNIYINTPQSNSLVEVYDILGNLVYSQLSKSGMNTVSANFGSGIYMVKVQSNGNVKTEKVVISK